MNWETSVLFIGLRPLIDIFYADRWKQGSWFPYSVFCTLISVNWPHKFFFWLPSFRYFVQPIPELYHIPTSGNKFTNFRCALNNFDICGTIMELYGNISLNWIFFFFSRFVRILGPNRKQSIESTRFGESICFLQTVAVLYLLRWTERGGSDPIRTSLQLLSH